MKTTTLTIAAAALLLAPWRATAQEAQAASDSRPESAPATRADSRPVTLLLKDTRTTMSKWTETQQIISRERREWQQGKDVLVGRVELVKQEVTALEEKIKQAEKGAAEAEQKKQALVVENDQLKATSAQLSLAAASLEGEIRKLHKRLPEFLKAKLQPLYQRVPEDPATTKVSIAERYQNVLGILNEVNKVNGEITVNYEVHTLGDGKPSEVKAIYVGLAQAYYVSAQGEGGIGRPTDEGWKWQPSKDVGRNVLLALEILQGKHAATFVPLPVKIQ